MVSKQLNTLQDQRHTMPQIDTVFDTPVNLQ